MGDAAAPASHRALARRVLAAAAPATKCAAAETALNAWRSGDATFDPSDAHPPPDRPARPAHPRLKPPAEVPRRRLGSPAGRIALLHAVAHIELNAIDLAFDMAARFAAEIDAAGLDADAFIDDWFAVGADEARHFTMLLQRLAALGAAYGDLPAHDGLWRAAQATSDDALSRLAIAPMVLEARGLDVTPGMIARLKKHGDSDSAAVLAIIYEEEVDHVRKGATWFTALCECRGVAPAQTFRKIVAARFAGALKPPFNDAARMRAGLSAELYAPLS